MREVDEFKETNTLGINLNSRDALNKIAKWTNFLGIVGLCYIGLLVVLAVAAPSFMIDPEGISSNGRFEYGQDEPNPVLFTVFFLLLAIIYVFPVWFLFKFSTKLRAGLSRNDDDTLAESFHYLRRHYVYIGVLVIIGLGFTAIGILANL